MSDRYETKWGTNLDTDGITRHNPEIFFFFFLLPLMTQKTNMSITLKSRESAAASFLDSSLSASFNSIDKQQLSSLCPKSDLWQKYCSFLWKNQKKTSKRKFPRSELVYSGAFSAAWWESWGRTQTVVEAQLLPLIWSAAGAEWQLPVTK